MFLRVFPGDLKTGFHSKTLNGPLPPHHRTRNRLKTGFCGEALLSEHFQGSVLRNSRGGERQGSQKNPGSKDRYLSARHRNEPLVPRPVDLHTRAKSCFWASLQLQLPRGLTSSETTSWTRHAAGEHDTFHGDGDAGSLSTFYGLQLSRVDPAKPLCWSPRLFATPHLLLGG